MTQKPEKNFDGLDVEVDVVEVADSVTSTGLDPLAPEVELETPSPFAPSAQTTADLAALASDPTIISVPQVARRKEKRSAWEEVTHNGTIAAAVMVFAALIAVAVANSPAYEVVHHIIETPLAGRIGNWHFGMSLEVFVNDFLMSIFFLLVGIELKYEMTVGQLKHVRQAALPMLAAVGGVAVPAIIYYLLNRGGAVHGWAVPIATDIAFALGVMSLLGDRVAPATKVFFSTLAIADDILAIIVIALAYGQTPSIFWITASLVVILVLFILNRSHAYNTRSYVIVGLVLWYCMYKSGIHATLAGVILAFFLPSRSDIKLSALGDWLKLQSVHLDKSYEENERVLGQHDFMDQAHEVERIMRHVTPPLQRMENYIATPVNFIILPLFAFVNAQVRLVGVEPSTILLDPVSQGAFLGAVLGKPLGIIGVTFLLVKIGFARLPEDVDWNQIIAVGLMGGLGFTMSILIAGLAFTDPQEVLAAKCAILAGSFTSAALGMLFVRLRCKKRNWDGASS